MKLTIECDYGVKALGEVDEEEGFISKYILQFS